MTISIHTHAFGATRSVSRPEAGVLSVDFQRTLPSGRAIEGGATFARNADGSVDLTVNRAGPNGRAGERSTTFSADEVSAFKDELRARIADRRDGPDSNNL